MLVEHRIRLAAGGDAGTIAGMSRDLVEQGLHWRYTPARVLWFIRCPQANVAVAPAGASVGGFGIMLYGEERAHLVLLAVHAGRRRRGVGRSLVRWLEKVALTAGIAHVALEVRASNPAALAFYERLGYTACARLHRYYDGVEDALQLVRDLRVG